MAKYEAFYCNGLGDGQPKPWEVWLFKHLEDTIHFTHAELNWRSGQSFTDLHESRAEQAQRLIRKHGHLFFVGASAGQSFAYNQFGKIKNPNTFAVGLCGRSHPGEDLPWWDKRTLERMAHLGTPKASQAFFDSVNFCHQVTIPSLTTQDKRRLATTKPWLDFVVPRHLMDVEGVEPVRINAIGHSMGIMLAGLRLPKIMASLSETNGAQL